MIRYCKYYYNRYKKYLRNKWVIAVAVLVLILIPLTVSFVKYQIEKREIKEVIDYEKQQLEMEYDDWTYRSEQAQTTIGNDSLLMLLDNERNKIHLLLEEMRTLESTNLRKMNELRKELADVRKVARQYLVQIDSLSRENRSLKTENTEIKRRNREMENNLQQLSQDKRALSSKVTQASILETANIKVDGMNIVGRKTTVLTRIENFQCCFRILKNKTAAVGIKDIYLRFSAPDGTLFETTDNSGITTFVFENKKIPFTSRKTIEYDGDNADICIFWKARPQMTEGTYRLEIFADGFLIGEKEVVL
ncbi:hypothetical protein FACS189434_09490 [Bacteroidia bacterium]|nr:hypothetical protein FACS189434_09490 [Bacteroidia bacterium]